MNKSKDGNSKVKVILKKGIPLFAQVAYVASVVEKACPDIWKIKDPYPTVRMVKFGKGEITYEISQGISRAKTGPV